MDFLKKIPSKIQPTSKIVTDAVPVYPDNNEDTPDSRIPPINIEELHNLNEPQSAGESSPIITEPCEDVPPVPPRRKKSKPKAEASKPTDKRSDDSDPDDGVPPETPPINTHANGSVINIVNSKGVHVGPSQVYHFGNSFSKETEEDSEASVPKTKTIVLVMKSKETINHEHMDVFSRNLGVGWRKVFRKLGYTDAFLDTFNESHHHKGLPEVIYQILLDWTRTGERTLGELCTAAWKEGKRLAVAEIAKLYRKNNKQNN